MNTQTQETPTAEGGERDHRELLPLWRIQGTITLKTPLSIGSGRDEPIDTRGKDEPESHVIAVMRDHQQRPYIPASSFKGALNALARQSDMPPETRECLFGKEIGNKTQPAQVEFCNLMAEKDTLPTQSGLPNWDVKGHPHTANLPHVVINRDYRTAEDKLLFLEQVVPPGVAFRFECTARAIDEAAVQALLGLLQLAGATDSPLRLGGGQAANNGRFIWAVGEIRRFHDPSKFWQVLSAPNAPASPDIWADPYSQKPSLTPAALKLVGKGWLHLAKLELKFHTPFLVYQPQPKIPGQHRPDGKPRTNHRGRAGLPASSLHGALRAQAERILRTVGHKVEKGYEVLAVRHVAEAGRKLDLAAVLFGAPGWRSLIRLSHFVAPKDARTLIHEMVAIDRLTGGGKDSAKFNIEVLDCPTLTGTLSLDLRRLDLLEKESPGVTAKVLGLLAHVLRDLDEGDIPLGYGAAKGYGRSQSTSWQALDAALKTAKPADIDGIGKALEAFAQSLGTAPASSTPTGGMATGPNAPTPTAGNGDFHNPYVFLPFGTPSPNDGRLPWMGHGSLNNSHHSHARYAPGAFNGRLVCRLTTKTPIFIGAGDVDPNTPDPKQKANFRLDNKIALPATSLRGMLSSLHESITSSALRVMADRTYSVRQETGKTEVNAYASSAIGRVHIRDGRVHIEPLTIPTLGCNNDDRYVIPDEYAQVFKPSGRHDWHVYHKVLLEPAQMQVPRNSHYANSKGHHFTDDRGRDYWYLPLEPLQVNARDNSIRGGAFRLKRDYLIGQRPTGNGAYPLSQEEFERLDADRQGYVRGFIRPMSYRDRQLPPPSVRKYELFVPYPVELDNQQPAAIPCTDLCIDRFAALAKERHELQKKDLPTDVCLRFPYTPVNQTRNDEPLSPSQGDLVFFKPNTDGSAVAEIAYSSIWRARLEVNGGTYSTANALSIVHLSPLNDQFPRNKLSPSELLFGCVELNTSGKQREQAQTRQTMAFASKVYFGYGTPRGDITLQNEITLKILSSPKPPSPPMYFQKRNGGAEYIPKAWLADNPANYVLKGRKAYLHALRDDAGQVQPLNNNGRTNGNRPPWITARPDEYQNQKVRIRPIEKNQAFFFEVDFVNLSQAELESLCACLVPHPAWASCISTRKELESLCACLMPHGSYEHKLGMGKPIGLGSVKIDIVGMYLVDRVMRYRQTDFAQAPRYASVWKPEAVDLPAHLQKEENAQATGNGVNPCHLANAQMHELLSKDKDKALFNAICLTGDPNAVKKPVHYPQLVNQDIERETFAWFVNNDKSGRDWTGPQQYLDGFRNNSTHLPALSHSPRTQNQQPAPQGQHHPRRR